MPILLKLREKYASAPEKLPYHVVVPSLVGFGFSSPPPLDKDFTILDIARIFNKMMVALGFGERGYITQGGDLGGPIAETLAALYDPVKGQSLRREPQASRQLLTCRIAWQQPCTSMSTS